MEGYNDHEAYAKETKRLTLFFAEQGHMREVTELGHATCCMIAMRCAYHARLLGLHEDKCAEMIDQVLTGLPGYVGVQSIKMDRKPKPTEKGPDAT